MKSKTPVQDQRCQAGSSARNSVVPSEGGFSKNYGADQQRPQLSDLHFDKFPTPATFTCWKIRFKTEVCTCSQFLTEALLWIKEVELVDSVDDLKSSCSAITDYDPNDYHFSETTEPDIQESSVENGSPNDFEYDDDTIGRALSSPLFTQEREDPAGRRQAYHSPRRKCVAKSVVFCQEESHCKDIENEWKGYHNKIV